MTVYLHLNQILNRPKNIRTLVIVEAEIKTQEIYNLKRHQHLNY